MTAHRTGQKQTLPVSSREDLSRLIVESVRDYAIFMLDPEGRVTTWNQGAERIKGYAGEEIIGRHFSAFYTAEDRAQGKPERALRTAESEGVFEQTGWRVRKDGSRFWADVLITPIRGNQGELVGFSKITRDVSDRRSAEQAREALLRQQKATMLAEVEAANARGLAAAAEQASRLKNEFLMTLSHELRTPITSILGWARLLDTGELDPDTTSQAIDSILASALRQAELIEDVLEVSQIVTGRFELDLVRTDLVPVLESVLSQFRPAAAEKQIEMRAELPKNGLMARIDAHRVRQIVRNLLSNAIKFTPERGTVELRLQRSGATALIEVEDDGEGIAADDLPDVFEMFHQADRGTARVHGGLGLGLSLARHLVHAHGGTLEAQSEGPGKGSALTVHLPLDGPPNSRR